MTEKNYYRINIKNVHNGYYVECGYKNRDKADDYARYESDEFVFTTWDQVVEFVKQTELEVPPKQV